MLRAGGLPDNESYLKTVLCHIHVNAAGDYYDIPNLQGASITKLQALFSKDWRSKLYPAIIKAALQKAGDPKLHDLLATTATDHLGDLIENDGFDRLDWDKDFTARVLKQCARRLNDGRRKDPPADQRPEKPDQEYWRPVKCKQCGDNVFMTVVQEMRNGVCDFSYLDRFEMEV
ncbi:unnamed protein product [Clonostachys rosea]|uniref:Uncharacterized protein n=1 Tax=Bionectria ochroleuca TaxID=29856 RepID=A0ABY6V3D6_BIOOC|nr:unnamed protein product [Clonostachys rosea]